MKDKSVSMAKGVAIILMVLGHTGFADYGTRFVYMFHMPLFFFVSGYCFKSYYLNDFRTFAVKRIKGAYWPYVKYGFLFLLFHNLFVYLHIYDTENGGGFYGLRDFLVHGFYVVGTMTHAEDMLGGYWFLHTYFIASFVFFLTVWVSRNRMGRMLLGAGLLLVVCSVILFLGRHFGTLELLAAFFMIAGCMYKRSDWQLERHAYTLPIGVLLVGVGVMFWPCNMQSVQYDQAAAYCFTAIVGSVMTLALARWLLRCGANWEKALTYVGDRTLVILTWHFLSFKIVSLVIIWVNGLPIGRLAEFPIMADYSRRGWWLAYLVVGILLPLTIDRCCRMVKKACCTKQEGGRD